MTLLDLFGRCRCRCRGWVVAWWVLRRQWFKWIEAPRQVLKSRRHLIHWGPSLFTESMNSRRAAWSSTQQLSSRSLVDRAGVVLGLVEEGGIVDVQVSAIGIGMVCWWCCWCCGAPTVRLWNQRREEIMAMFVCVPVCHDAVLLDSGDECQRRKKTITFQ